MTVLENLGGAANAWLRRQQGLSTADLEKLEKLADLRDKGVLTPEEFEHQSSIVRGVSVQKPKRAVPLSPASPTAGPALKHVAKPANPVGPTRGLSALFYGLFLILVGGAIAALIAVSNGPEGPDNVDATQSFSSDLFEAQASALPQAAPSYDASAIVGPPTAGGVTQSNEDVSGESLTVEPDPLVAAVGADADAQRIEVGALLSAGKCREAQQLARRYGSQDLLDGVGRCS